ncbi:hypothetical protein [Rhodococcus sp. MEB032]|uniref:hypothetical protein n=1 Tax=Rhodococcus sp. MEB032 TaxID=3040322 RepID=UPI0025519BC5|nr:hypothetical protein [Rhodococcus sp. MEB032]
MPVDNSNPSLISQIPGWLTSSIIAAVITVVVGTILTVKFWQPIWRTISRQHPVYVHVETDPAVLFANAEYDWITFSQFVPLQLPEIPPPPGGFATEMGAWAANLGGFPARHCNYGVTLTAREGRHVVVSAFRVQAKAVDLPSGSVVTKGVGGASMEFRRIQIDLHTQHARASYVEMGGTPGSPFEFQLAPGESAKFNLLVDASTDEHVDMYEWWGNLDLLVDGKRRTLRIGRGWWARKFNRGRDFKLVNAGRRPTYMHMPGSAADWEPSPF